MPEKHVNVYYHELKPIFLVLKLIGIMPYQVTSQGQLEFNILSLEVAYSIIVQSGVLAITAFTIWVYVLQIQIQSFSIGMFYTTLLVFLSSNVLVLPTHWLEIKDLVHFINMWMQFQDDFHFVTGQSLTIKLRLRAIATLIIAAVFFVCGTILSVWRGCVNDECGPVSVITRAYTFLVVILVPGLWEISCEALTQSARKIITHIRQSSRPSRFTALWFRLNTMTKELGLSQGWTTGLVTLNFFVLQVLLSYAVVVDFKIEISMYTAVLSLSFGLIIFTICNSGETANLEMREKMTKYLYDVEDRIPASNRQAISEIHKFIAIINRNAIRISFSGFAIVGRSLSIAFSSSLVTYIIVLAQFGMNSVPDAKNATSCISLQNETSSSIG